MALRNRRRNTIYFVVLAGLLAIIFVSYRSLNSSQSSERRLSDLLTAVDDRQVASATFTSQGDRVDWVDVQGHRYRTFLTSSYADVLVDKLHQERLPIVVTAPSSDNLWLTVVLPNVILLLIIGSFMWYMLRRTQRLRNQ